MFLQWLKELWQGYPDSGVAMQVKIWISETNSDSIHWRFVACLDEVYATSYHYQVIEHPKIAFACGYARCGIGEGLAVWVDNIQIEAPRRLLKKLNKAIDRNIKRQNKAKQEEILRQFQERN